MNGDGLMDVVMGSGELATERVTPGEFAVSIAFGEAAGTYAPCRSIGVPSGPIRAMDIGDVDGDGDGSALFNGAIWTRRDASGQLSAFIELVTSDFGCSRARLVDLDADGDLDLLGTRVNGTRLAVSFNDGTGRFSQMGSLGGGFPAALEFEYVDLDVDFDGDFDGDGALDMAMVPSGTATPIYVMFGVGDGTFGLISTVSTTSQGWSTLRAVDFDIDGDGDQDLLAGLEEVAALGVFKARANRSLGGGVYCIGAVPNSTGQVGTMVAIGSDVPADNRLTLRSNALPAASFGFYLASLAAALAASCAPAKFRTPAPRVPSN